MSSPVRVVVGDSSEFAEASSMGAADEQTDDYRRSCRRF
jgi:hypothetical protein